MSQLPAFLEAHPGWEPIESDSEEDDDDDEEENGDNENEDKHYSKYLILGFVCRFFVQI